MNYNASFSVRIALLLRSNEHSSLSSPSGNIPKLQEQNWWRGLIYRVHFFHCSQLMCCVQHGNQVQLLPIQITIFILFKVMLIVVICMTQLQLTKGFCTHYLMQLAQHTCKVIRKVRRRRLNDKLKISLKRIHLVFLTLDI